MFHELILFVYSTRSTGSQQVHNYRKDCFQTRVMSEGEEVGGGARSQWRAEVPWQEGTDKVTDASAILE